MEFTGVYQKKGKWFIGWVKEIPGVNTQGKTLREVKENLRELLNIWGTIKFAEPTSAERKIIVCGRREARKGAYKKVL